MPELSFRVEDADFERHAATPQIRLRLHVGNDDAVDIRNLMLQCQVRIETQRRDYAGDEQSRLVELFGRPEQWQFSLHSMLWTHVGSIVPPFAGECTMHLALPCSYDLNLAVAKYCHGLQQGEIPLLLLFSGSVFYRDAHGELQLQQIPWSCEARYRLPLEVWQRMMDHHYPDTAWLPLSRKLYDRIYRYKCEQGLPTWDRALSCLLDRGMEAP